MIHRYSIVAVVSLGFEQFAITLQALRGQKLHFTYTDSFGAIVFRLRDLFIL